MNEFDQFETELRRLRPAKPPQEFLDRLAEALPSSRQNTSRMHPAAGSLSAWRWWVRWLAPAMALAIVFATLSWRLAVPAPQRFTRPPEKALAPKLKADRVEIDRHLIAAFDAVTRLPNGEPVRLRCREWADNVVLHDSNRGITIERRTPRLEIIPVSLETY